MIICHCKRVTDGELRAAVRNGCGSAEAIASRCGAGGRCGGCRPAIDEILAEEAPRLATLRWARSA